MTQIAVQREFAQRTAAGKLTRNEMENMKTRVKLNWLIVMAIALTGLPPTARAFYAPAAQRWLNRDPISEIGFEWLHRKEVTLGDAPNLFFYVQNDPVDRWDALGLCPGECFSAGPEDKKSNVCSKYGDRKYLGVNMSCFCRCAGNSDWSKDVRGCLACMDAKGVDESTAHITCYEAADKKYSRPNLVIAFCTAACK